MGVETCDPSGVRTGGNLARAAAMQLRRYGDGDSMQLRRWIWRRRCHTVTKMDMETAMPCSYEDGYWDGDAMQLRRCRGYAPM